jgi:hypothetical protein
MLLSLSCILSGIGLAGAVEASDGTLGPRALDEERWHRLSLGRVELHYAPGLPLDPEALEDLRRFVESAADSLGLDRPARESLLQRPIRYFWTDAPELIRALGGGDAEGMALPEERIAVSLRLPHEHELVHVLAHVAVRPGPDAVVPLLREGLASALGGSADRVPRVILAEGDQLLQARRLDLRELSAPASFEGAALDERSKYAASARFVQFLWSAGGIGRLKDLYRLLSGAPVEIAQRTRESVVAQIEGVYSVPWSELERRFEWWRAQNPAGGIRLAQAPAEAADLWLIDGGQEAQLWTQADGSILLRGFARERSHDQTLWWGESVPALYRRGGLEHPGYGAARQRFGLQIRAGRIELRDHRRDRLIAVLAEPAALPATPELVLRIEAEVMAESGSVRQAELWELPRFEP